MITIFRKTFLSSRFFIVASLIILLFIVSFVWPHIFEIGLVTLVIFVVIVIADIALLVNKQKYIYVERIVPTYLSLSDKNRISLDVKNNTGLKLQITIFDEVPYQLQMRDFYLETVLKHHEEKHFDYFVTPVTRGKYEFGNINLFITSFIGLVNIKHLYFKKTSVPVYPSIIQMKKLELSTRPSHTNAEGIKKHRRIGHSYEFDQVKEYVIGDDSRSINWKATSRKGMLMVNQYEDERSQQIYSIIDKGRTMRMPFNGLTLLDYSINSVLAISNIILQKHDKAGLITFSNKIGTIIPAEKTSQQLKKILEALYNEKEVFLESEYELMFHLVRNVIKNRSLLFLYTNFESYHAFERVLPILRQINKFHLLVIVFFDNEEVLTLCKQPVDTALDIYIQTIARKYIHEKNQIVTELANHGILSIKTLPADLSINTINKYLELKSRGVI